MHLNKQAIKEGSTMGIYEEKNRRTKELIQRSFLTLLEEKPFDSITVGDISKVASINRGTFYLHYLDKYDLLEKIEQQLFENIGDHIDRLQENYTTAATFEKEQEHLAASLFSSIQAQAPVLKIFLSHHGRAGFHYRFRDAFSRKVRVNLEKNISLSEQLNVSIDYFLAFITSAFLGLIEQWVQNGLDKSPEEMTQLYIEIIRFIQNRKE